MNSVTVAVTFQPQGKTVQVATGATAREAAALAGVMVDYPCGGQGTCGKCRVRIRANAEAPGPVESQVLSPSELDGGTRLACQTHMNQSLTIEVPETSLLASSYKILSESAGVAESPLDPPVRKRYVELPRPSLEDDTPDFDRINRAYGPLTADLHVLRMLSERLRDADFRGTLVTAGDSLIDFEAGDTTRACHALAFDVGTTTVVGILLDLATGVTLAQASRLNPQTSHGDDVLSRILHATQQPGGLDELRAAIIDSVNAMIDELIVSAGIDRETIYTASFAGNTTMQHLLSGLDPRALGQLPFVPAVRCGLRVAARDLAIRIHPRGEVSILPVIGGFVGGDTVAGVLATGIAASSGPVMLIDIGTNGELVLHHGGRLEAASCAAGPAFEGAKIAHGMRAVSGAIEEIHVEESVTWKVIGGGPPSGMCGSALIDIVAELLRVGIVMSQGLMLAADQLPDTVPAKVRERITVTDSGPAFTIAYGHETLTGRPIELTQQDIREVQLATAAIRTGFTILLKRAGVEPETLDRVYVAGAFGNYIRCANAQRMGLLPHRVPEDRMTFAGNTSLAGARRVAVSRAARRDAERLAQLAEHVELSRDPAFHEVYVEAMFFPE